MERKRNKRKDKETKWQGQMEKKGEARKKGKIRRKCREVGRKTRRVKQDRR